MSEILRDAGLFDRLCLNQALQSGGTARPNVVVIWLARQDSQGNALGLAHRSWTGAAWPRAAKIILQPPLQAETSGRPFSSVTAGALLGPLLQSATYHTNGAAQQLIFGGGFGLVRRASGRLRVGYRHFVRDFF